MPCSITEMPVFLLCHDEMLGKSLTLLMAATQNYMIHS